MNEEIVKKTKEVRQELDRLFTAMQTMFRSRETALAITKLQESKMWLGKLLGEFNEPNPYPESKNAVSQAIEPTADAPKQDITASWEAEDFNLISKVKDLRYRIEQQLPKIFAFIPGNEGSLVPSLTTRGWWYVQQAYINADSSMMWLGMELGRIRETSQDDKNQLGVQENCTAINKMEMSKVDCNNEDAIASERDKQFLDELSTVLNRYSYDNHCETPDFMLAAIVKSFLHNFAASMVVRDKYREPIPCKMPE